MGVSIWNYSNRKCGNSQAVTIENLDLYFSYKTVVAFRDLKTGLVIRKNDWGQTTGRHLNSISPDKSVRIPGPEFEKRLSSILKTHNL